MMGSNTALLPYDSGPLYESFMIMVGQVTTSHVYVMLNEVDTNTRLVSLWLCFQGHLTTGNTVDVNLKRVLTLETVWMLLLKWHQTKLSLSLNHHFLKAIDEIWDIMQLALIIMQIWKLDLDMLFLKHMVFIWQQYAQCNDILTYAI